MSITKYGALDSDVDKTAEGRQDAEEQRKTAEKKHVNNPERHIETVRIEKPK